MLVYLYNNDLDSYFSKNRNEIHVGNIYIQEYNSSFVLHYKYDYSNDYYAQITIGQESLYYTKNSANGYYHKDLLND